MTQVQVIECLEPNRIKVQMPAYLIEMNQYTGDAPDLTEYPYLDFYWQQPDRQPFLLTREQTDCGFALVRKVSSGSEQPDYHTIAEFFVQPQHRRQEFGLQAVAQLLGRRSGPWLIQVLNDNLNALEFWQNSLSQVTGTDQSPIPGPKYYDFSFNI